MDVHLGEVTCPSGELVVVDGGYLGLWSGDGSPLDLDPEVLGRIPDAEIDGNVAHRELARRCARTGGGEFSLCNVPAVAVGGLPVDRLLAVVARPVEDDSGWESFRVVGTDAPVNRSVRLGEIGVDWARIAFGDADALAHWRHDEAIDELADVAFWGAAEQEAAAVFGAPLLDTPGEEGVHGWTDLPIRDAAERAQTITDWRDENAVRRLMVDFRPHSHHWQVMRGVRASGHGAGMVEVGGAWLLCAMTSWGDGFFPVFADLDEANSLVAVRVVLSEDA